MKAAGTQFLREFHGVRGSENVGGRQIVGRCLEVVERAQVQKVIDLALHRAALLRADAEQRLFQIAPDRNQQVASGRTVPDQAVEARMGARSNQHPDRQTPGDEPRHDVPPDETGGACDEIGHAGHPTPKMPRSNRGNPRATTARV